MPFHYISRRAQMARSFYSGIGKTAVIYPAAFLVTISVGMLLLAMVFYLQEKFGASDSQIGLCAGGWSLSYVIGCLFLRPLAGMIYVQHLLAVCALLVTIGILMAQGYVHSLFHGLEGSTNRAARSALHESLLSGGLIIGASVGGFISQRHSLDAAYRTFIVVLLLAAAIQCVICLAVRGGKRRETCSP